MVQNLNRWLNGFLIGLFIFTLVLVLFLGIQYILALYVWPQNLLAETYKSYSADPLTQSGDVLDIQYKQVVPFDQPVYLQIRHPYALAADIPFQVDLATSSPDILFEHYPEAAVPARRVTLKFSSKQSSQVQVKVINTHKGSGLFYQTAKIEITYKDKDGKPQVLMPVDGSRPAEDTVSTETSWIAVLAAQKPGNLSESALVAVITGASALGAFFLKTRKEQQVDEENEQKKNKAAAEELFHLLRENLKAEKIAEAEKNRQKLKKNGLEKYLFPADLDQAQRLLKIESKDPQNMLSYLSFPDGWGDETAGAICFMVNLKQFMSISEKAELLRSFPFDRCTHESQQKILSLLQQLNIRTPSVDRKWPVEIAFPDREFDQETLGTGGIVQNPFRASKAEYEENFLFGKRNGGQMFYPLHSLYRKLNLGAGQPLLCVTSLPGMGRTALALALGRYLHESNILAVYLAGQPDAQSICHAFCLQLIRYIEQNPAYLEMLDTRTRQSLAALLVQHLERIYPLAQVSLLIAALQSAPEKRSEALPQLILFHQALEQTAPSSLPEKEWLYSFHSLVYQLGLDRLRVVIDAPEQASLKWFLDQLQGILDFFLSDKGELILFLPQKAFQVWQENGLQLSAYHFPTVALNWADKETNCLSTMLSERWKAVNPGVIDISQAFGSDGEGKYQAMLDQAQANPGRFVQLWRSHFGLDNWQGGA
jgi:hypothetical protein